jgi:hypothetical protein
MLTPRYRVQEIRKVIITLLPRAGFTRAGSRFRRERASPFPAAKVPLPFVMGQRRGNPLFGPGYNPRGPAPRPKRFYDLETLPAYARAGGAAWADDFARLPTHEQRAIVTRLTVERARYWARRKGYPEPIFCECDVKPSPGGGFVKVEGSERPLRAEYGGRTYEDALKASTDPVGQVSLRQAIVADKFRKKWEKLGVVFEEAEPPKPIKTSAPPRPKKAAKG